MALVTVLLAAGCASSGGVHPTTHRRADRAATPKAAAVGFDRSLRSHPRTVRFGCDDAGWWGLAEARGTPKVTSTRVDDQWIVTIAYPPPVPQAAYTVTVASWP